MARLYRQIIQHTPSATHPMIYLLKPCTGAVKETSESVINPFFPW